MPTFREDVKIGGMVPMMKTDDINDQAITKDKIRDGNVTAEKLADGAVSTDKLPDGAIKTPKIADGNITTSKLAEASVVTSKIADQNVTKEKIADQSVDNSKLSPEAVTYDKLKDKSVITEKLNDRAVTTEKIEEKAITNAKIGDSAVDGRTIGEASVEKKHLANDSVATEKLQDSSVTSDKIHTNAVTEEKIDDSAISNSKLADNSVGTSKIKDGNVTNEKVANNTITIDKFDPELRKSIQAATGLPENLVEVIQDVDVEVKSLHSKDEDLQSQIADKQQQITANNKDIESLQNRSTQMEQSINNIAVTGGASVANTVAYSNTASGLVSINAQSAIDELAAKNATKAEKAEVTAELEKKFNKESILQESGEAEDKVMSQKATTTAIADETTRAKEAEEAIIFDVSVNNNGAVFESLQALLSSQNLNTLIPTSARRGGMTIRFIQGSEQSSDNKYVQWRLRTQSFTTNVEEWVLSPSLKVVENKKYAYALLDINDIFLIGIRRDNGKIEYGFGIPDIIIKAIEDSSNIGEGIFLKDIIKNIHSELYPSALIDANGKELEVIKQNGEKSTRLTYDFRNGFKLNGKYIIKNIHSELYPSALIDANGKELEVIKQNGEKSTRLTYDFRNGFKLNGKLYRNEKDLRKDNTKSASPLMFDLTGDGSEVSPYTYKDGNAGISSAIATLTRGGLVTIPCSKYNISRSIQLTSRNVRIVGECQAFPDDPLAVRPATSGTMVNLVVNTIPAFVFLGNEGGEMSHLGIYGTERNGNMANKFDKNNYLYESGINLKRHVDQMDFHRMSISALACGLVIDTDGAIDACIFDNLNFDGCDFGIYQPPTETWCGCCRFENIVFADMSGRAMHFSNITRFWFKDITISAVGGGTPTQVAALDGIRTLAYFKSSSSFFSSFDIFMSGKANPVAVPNWLDEYNGSCYGLYIEGIYNNITTNIFNFVTDYCLYIKGNKNIISANNIANSNTKGIYLEGNDNIISDNIIQLTSSLNIAIYIKGDNNIVNGNLTDGQIIIDGNKNKIMNHTSKTNSTYITVSGNSNILYDINTSEVTDNGINTIFKNI